jgi:hypothetical protein
MLDLCVLLVERFYEKKGSDNIKKLNQDEQKEVCDKFDQVCVPQELRDPFLIR